MNNLNDVLKEGVMLAPTNGRPIAVFPCGKIHYAKLILKDGSPFAASTQAEADESIALIQINDYGKFLSKHREEKTGMITPSDYIKVTKVNFNNAVGTLIF